MRSWLLDLGEAPLLPVDRVKILCLSTSPVSDVAYPPSACKLGYWFVDSRAVQVAYKYVFSDCLFENVDTAALP